MAETPDVRGQIAKTAHDQVSQIESFFAEVLSSERSVRRMCPHCGLGSDVSIPDWTSRTKALELMLNQGFGRPSSEEQEGKKGFLLRRTLVFPGGVEVVTHDEWEDEVVAD